MTAIEASAVVSAWILAVARLLRTGVPLLRLTNSRWALAVIACIPLLPQAAEAFGGAATELDFADAALQSVVALTAAVRGSVATDSAKVMLLGIFAFVSLPTACAGSTYGDALRRSARAHAVWCETCAGDSVRSLLGDEELEDYERACDEACAIDCREAQ